MASTSEIKTVISDLEKSLTSYSKKILNNSVRSGDTPSENQFKNELTGLVNNSLATYSGLTADEKNYIKNVLNNFSGSALVPSYNDSLKKYPRSVNHKLPTAVSDSFVSNAKSKFSKVKSNLSKYLTELLKDTVRTGRTPSQNQLVVHMNTKMLEYVNALGGEIDAQTKTYLIGYLEPWAQEVAEKSYNESLRISKRPVTNDFPWSDTEPGDTLDGDILDKGISLDKGNSAYTRTYQTFSGHDMVCTIHLTLPDGTDITKVIGSLQTLTYSIHQDKHPVRSVGTMNAKDYVFGPRTIAGTLIFTVFNKHWAYQIIDEYQKAGSTNLHFLVDELPPFQITISAANEYGQQARLALYGVRIVNEGQVMSINDVYTENTYQFVATDLDYLTDRHGYNSSSNAGTDHLPNLPPTQSIPTVEGKGQTSTSQNDEASARTSSIKSFSQYSSLEQAINDIEKERQKSLDRLWQQLATDSLTAIEYGRAVSRTNSAYNELMFEAKKAFEQAEGT